MILTFDKKVETDRYAILFNTKTGLEITSGINGFKDPFILDMASLLDIGVMGTCKHKCIFCYQGHEDRPNMKLSDFKRIIDEVSWHVNQVALGGRGDPNHHENFREIIEYCREKNVIPNYTTSGIGLTSEQIEISKMCGAVAVSDYEKPYTNDALNMLMDAGIKTNIHQIYSNESHIKCLGIIQGHKPLTWGFDHTRLNAVIFLLFKPHGAGKLVKHLRPTEAQIQTIAKEIFQPQSKFKIGMDSCLVNHVLKYANPSAVQRASVDTCEASRMSAYVTPDMKMMPCSFADETKFSVPITDGLSKIWEDSDPFNNFRQTLQRTNECCPLGL